MEQTSNSQTGGSSASGDANRFHRAPALARTLGSITPDDIRVRLLCRVIDKTVTGVIVEDVPARMITSEPAPQMEVMLEQDVLASLNKSDVIRAFSRVIPFESGFELRGEFVQDMSALDVELYKRVHRVDESE